MAHNYEKGIGKRIYSDKVSKTLGIMQKEKTGSEISKTSFSLRLILAFRSVEILFQLSYTIHTRKTSTPTESRYYT